MVAKKLTDEDCEKIAKLINEGHQIKGLAKRYGVHRSVISRRCKAMHKSREIPAETMLDSITLKYCMYLIFCNSAFFSEAFTVS